MLNLSRVNITSKSGCNVFPIPRAGRIGVFEQATASDLWTCRFCTFRNDPGRPGCEMCGNAAPNDEQHKNQEYWDYLDKKCQSEFLASEEVRKRALLDELERADANKIVEPDKSFDCKICMDFIDHEMGVRLRQCLHDVCKKCLLEAVKHDDTGDLKCPECSVQIDYRDIENSVDDKSWAKFLKRSRRRGLAALSDKRYCMSPDCEGAVEIGNSVKVDEFLCPECRELNCLKCKVIHTNKSCEQFWEEFRPRKFTDEQADKMTDDAIEEMQERGTLMKCPVCQVMIQKAPGCDWMVCPTCQTEICWATKGPRWGPKGRGDTSGGCRCGIDGKRCNPSCNFCH